MHTPNYKKTKYTCYFSNLVMSTAFSLPPLLFVTFRELYGVSYSLLGTLVLVNFCTQFLVDLVFSIFSKHFNIKAVIRAMPLLTSIGFGIYALAPILFPNNVYIGLLIGTFAFSAASGLSEVNISPLVAALPSDTPEKDMSMLHSLYAWGVLGVVSISTLFFWLFGRENWQYLVLIFAIIPLISFFLYCTSPIPDIQGSNDRETKRKNQRSLGFALCVACIFFGAAAENAMTNWVSGFVEKAFDISKTVGDILGMALFALLMGLGRTLYAKYGKNIYNILLLGMSGAVVCYLVAGLSPNLVLALIACVLTGLCTSMLWPGTLIFMEGKYPNLGVVAYAIMAAGGDFGGSVSAQLLGIVVDTVSSSKLAASLATPTLTPEQIGMKAGMVCTAIFPSLGVVVLLWMRRYFKAKDMRTLEK